MVMHSKEGKRRFPTNRKVPVVRGHSIFVNEVLLPPDKYKKLR
jgi:hypothetical protein